MLRLLEAGEFAVPVAGILDDALRIAEVQVGAPETSEFVNLREADGSL
jgi:hypothetical protein